MRFLKGIRWISTVNKHPTSFQRPPLVTESSQVFDPDVWQSSEFFDDSEFLTSSDVAPAPESSTSSSDPESPLENTEEESQKAKKKPEDVEENRADGHAPIKSALSILMQSLQKTSSMTTSLSDIDVTLFNFHSTKFAERLLNRNVSSVVMVESSHVFSKNAKKIIEIMRYGWWLAPL
ncbi:hypothetical protein GCK72_020253 [Caenorhabditis remanei]|uniref:Uncharacterized protein n=1 Tax=Caenorhabditis remanei TaxID=31234 RepID=A0A6A5GG55_CAERE|nr:hypothetical protein GCK72_020253 [Caenorhabditis remanei]KAF1753696.1 hypothetical protein GCK72_020253 [Caenorhabditis remanei]